MSKDKSFRWGDGRKIVVRKVDNIYFNWDVDKQNFYITDEMRGFQLPKKTALKFVRFVNKYKYES